MLPHLADVSIRSLLLALPAAMVLWMLRRTRTAALQHAVWAIVVCGMLALFALGQALPRLPLRLPARPAAGLRVAFASPARSGQTPETTPLRAGLSAKPRRSIDWTAVPVYLYGVVALAFLARFATGMFLVRKLLAKSSRVQNFLESERIAIPMTVGWLRPVIVLPLEWRRWEREKLDAVLAHEGAHVRRHDGLVAALAAVNRCLFWFHPLAWMLERKLALLAEQACDESCVAALGDRRRYANLLLEMALAVDGSHGRLRSHAPTMASPSHIRQRIDSLLQEGRTFSRGLTRGGWAALLLCGIPLVWGAGAVELDRQAAPAQAATPHKPVAATPKFDVASIKPCTPGDGAGGGRSGRGGGGGRGIARSPGRLNVICMSAVDMLDIAYQRTGSNRLVNDSGGPFQADRIKGGPAWARSDRYTIEAESDDPAANGPTDGFTPTSSLLMGPMLQALLEDRFQLKIHREIEEVPMYALTVAKSGLKLKPMEKGGCDPDGPPEWVKGGKPPCGWTGWDVHGPNRILLGGGITLSRLADDLGELIVDRHVLDNTGVAAIFNLRLEYAPDESTHCIGPARVCFVDPSSDIPPGAAIYTALEQQLGLKLESTKGTHGFIVIDSIERPSEN